MSTPRIVEIVEQEGIHDMRRVAFYSNRIREVLALYPGADVRRVARQVIRPQRLQLRKVDLLL
jgi:hypothetical protein